MENKEQFVENVVKYATHFLGVQEKTGNIFSDEDELGKLLHLAGQKSGEPWCAYFGEVIYKLAFEPDYTKWDDDNYIKKLSAAFSASAVQTFYHFDGSKNFEISKIPQVGGLMIFRNYYNGQELETGHLAIIIAINGNSIKTIEGNTNTQGGREGIEVGKLNRVVDFDIPKKGKKLVLLGFVNPK